MLCAIYLLQEEISLSSCEVFVDPFEEAEAKVSYAHGFSLFTD